MREPAAAAERPTAARLGEANLHPAVLPDRKSFTVLQCPSQSTDTAGVQANAVELGFSQVVKNLERDRAGVNANPITAIRAAMMIQTPQQCAGFVRRSDTVVREWLPGSRWWNRHPQGF